MVFSPLPYNNGAPPSPINLIWDLDLDLIVTPLSSIATTATTIFLLSFPLSHFLIVVWISQPPSNLPPLLPGSMPLQGDSPPFPLQGGWGK